MPAQLSLPAVRTGKPASSGIAEYREQVAGLAALHPAMPEIERERVEIGGVDCLVVGNPNPEATLMYMHGGGFRLGDPDTWGGFACRLAAAGNLRLVLPNYRLAPEEPFPAALHDIAAVYDALHAKRSGPLLLAGDSAGGGLAAALTSALLAAGMPGPDGLILLSPWLDLTVTATTYESHQDLDQMFSRSSAQEAADLYLQGIDPADALASPLHADLSSFPPVQIFCGGNEVLLGDSLAFVERLAKANRTVEAHFVGGMQHVWPMIAPGDVASAKLVEALARFTRSFAP